MVIYGVEVGIVGVGVSEKVMGSLIDEPPTAHNKEEHTQEGKYQRN